MRRSALSGATWLALATMTAGCSTLGPTALTHQADGGSGFSYGAGRATQAFVAPPAATQAALRGALEDLRIQTTREIHDGTALIYEGTTADSRSSTFTLRPHALGTRLTARIGLFGDEALSRAFMDRVGIRLGSLPPLAIPAELPSTPGTNPYFSRSAIPDAEMLKDRADAPFKGTEVP